MTQKSLPLHHNVPAQYSRSYDPQLLPPRVGHNWNDQAFRARQDKPQQLEEEFRGRRAFLTSGNYNNGRPGNWRETTLQLLTALSTKPGKGRNSEAEKLQYMTLEDKVLRFYAFFTERAPEGGKEEYWHRKVTICVFPEDDTVLIYEPPVPNSGMDGGTYLTRQKVIADPRQREEFPDDEYLTVNFFNVGQYVRINAVEFFLYDCDAATRTFLTELGVHVGEPVSSPDDNLMTSYKDYQQKLAAGKFGILSHDFHGDEAVRAARFVRDSGKMLRFYGILDERNTVPGGVVRKLEVLMFVEDGSVAILERQNTAEEVFGLFLSRRWLPRDGSLAKANELSFAHRVNGMREPYIGPNMYYEAPDFQVGATINVLGRSVNLYDADDFTREYYQNTFGIQLTSARDLGEYVPPANSTPRPKLPPIDQPNGKPHTQKGPVPKRDVLRFLLRLAPPNFRSTDHRRFTLGYYTDTRESMVHETVVRNNGFVGGCFSSRQRLRKPVVAPKRGGREGRNPAATTVVDEDDESQYYSLEELSVGNHIVVSGHKFEVCQMDTHTANYLAGKVVPPPSEEHLANLLHTLREYLGSRYGSAVKAFLAFDHDRDGVVSYHEFLTFLARYQITDEPNEGQALFDFVVSRPETGYLTTEDLMRFLAGQDASGKENAKLDIEGRVKLASALGSFQARLEARCLNSSQMFRLLSTMPRAYRGRRADVHTLSNAEKDAVVTPIQLRICLEQMLGTPPSEEEMHCIVNFFFPTLPAELYHRTRDEVKDYCMDFPTFLKRWQAMTSMGMLPKRKKGESDAAEPEK